MRADEPILAHPSVEVNASDFYDAVSKLPKTKRGPAGTKGNIPKETVLSPHEGGIMVETPVMASLVHASNPWRVVVLVDAWKLRDLCDRYKKLGVFKQPKSIFLISVAEGGLRVRFETMTMSIPTVTLTR